MLGYVTAALAIAFVMSITSEALAKKRAVLKRPDPSYVCVMEEQQGRKRLCDAGN
jgi:hypothetical protein